MSNCIVKIEHLKKSYGNVTPIEDLNCEVNKGEVISIIGGSGVGKTTLIRMINLLDKPTSGNIYIDGENILLKNVDLNRLRKKVGMVFQNYNLFPHMTVIENIMHAPSVLKVSSKNEIYNMAMKLLNKVGLANKAFSFPKELSGGQKQRVAIARALAMRPEIILFDEPTSALDPTMTLEIVKVIEKLKKDNLTMIIVSHDMNFVKNVSTRVFYLDEGTIYEEGSPSEIFDNPKKVKTIGFIKKHKVFNITLNNYDFDFVGSASQVSRFCIEHNINQIMKQNIELAFEEICATSILNNTILLSKNNDKINLTFEIEYSLEKNESKLTIKYSGIKYDIKKFLDKDNAESANELGFSDDISYSIIKRLLLCAEYKYSDGDEYANELIIYTS